MAVVRDVMTPNPVSLDTSATLLDAARAMKDAQVGAVVVTEGGDIRGIVTDRDLVVRGIAEGRDPKRTRLGEVHTANVTVADPLHTVEAAAQFMKERGVQRIPVVAEGKAIGIVSMADLAAHLQPDTPIAEITGANAKH